MADARLLPVPVHLVGAAVSTGLIESLAQALAWTVGWISTGAGLSPTATVLAAALIVLWVSGFLSAVIDTSPTPP
jgi:hypothetical protein